MKINRKLNLVVPIYQGDDVLYVHSSPIAPVIFEQYFDVIAKTYAEIYSGGYGIASGPRIAYMLLKRVSGDRWEDVQKGLVAEIVRLTNVIIKGDRGWETVPYQEALDKKRIELEDISEVNNALVFFTVASSMHKRIILAGILDAALGLWGAQTTSSNCTEYASSLPTSTPGESSGGTPIPTSSVPY